MKVANEGRKGVALEHPVATVIHFSRARSYKAAFSDRTGSSASRTTHGGANQLVERAHACDETPRCSVRAHWGRVGFNSPQLLRRDHRRQEIEPLKCPKAPGTMLEMPSRRQYRAARLQIRREAGS
jgi:hypothetical protein